MGADAFATARVAPVNGDAATAAQREAVTEWMTDRNVETPPGPLWWLLVRVPDAMRRIAKVGAYARGGTELPTVLRAAAAFVCSERRGFEYEVAIHGRTISNLDDPSARLEAIVQRDYSALGPDVAAVVRLADAVAGPEPIDEHTIDEVRTIVGEDGLVQLALVMTYFLMLGDFARVLLPS